jgi:hypothetical protein
MALVEMFNKTADDVCRVLNAIIGGLGKVVGLQWSSFLSTLE